MLAFITGNVFLGPGMVLNFHSIQTCISYATRSARKRLRTAFIKAIIIKARWKVPSHSSNAYQWEYGSNESLVYCTRAELCNHYKVNKISSERLLFELRWLNGYTFAIIPALFVTKIVEYCIRNGTFSSSAALSKLKVALALYVLNKYM